MVLVFSKEITSRLKYTVGLIFHDILGTDVEVTSDPVRFSLEKELKINYSDVPGETGLYLKAGKLLFETGLKIPDVKPIVSEGETGFFETSAESFLPFDPFASTFLLVSRMEEYLPGPRDRFGRFPARSSLLYRYGLLEKPLVNRWAMLISREMEKYYGKSLFPERKFRFLPTIDVDNAWAFRHKGFPRTVAASVKDLVKGDFSQFRNRLRVLSGKEKDPYDTYGYLKELFKDHENQVVFFFLMGDYAPYDKQVSWKNHSFRELVSEIGQHFEVGIHPSMVSSKPGRQNRLKTEKNRLENILGKKVIRSRHHYVRINLPETYLQLISAGISEDYSMGFPELPGFRAGICTPFYFYDLTREKVTSLKIFPFQMMEVTFSQYLNQKPSEALERIISLMEEVKAAGGMFSAIWHNESLREKGDGEGFRPIFEKIISTGFRYADKF